jgi:hypothetical protein
MSETDVPAKENKFRRKKSRQNERTKKQYSTSGRVDGEELVGVDDEQRAGDRIPLQILDLIEPLQLLAGGDDFCGGVDRPKGDAVDDEQVAVVVARDDGVSGQLQRRNRHCRNENEHIGSQTAAAKTEGALKLATFWPFVEAV